MDWLLVFLMPAAVFAIFGALSPRVGPPPRWRLRLHALLARWTAPLRARLGRAAHRVRPARPPVVDPFESLRVQTRLGVLADELRALEADRQVYAKAHRIMATRAAYDDLLGEACRLAGVQLVIESRRSESERRREELELTARGWNW